MKLFIINKKGIYMLLIAILIIISIIIYISIYNKIDETFRTDVYYKGNIDKKVVTFACNVDWGDEHIPSMLQLFKKYDVRITYFVTGRWAEKSPELLKAMYDHGHEIGNHGYRHVDYDQLGYEQNKEEIIKAHNAIKNILEIQPNYFAPPSGAYNDNTVKAAKDLNYDIIMWSIDTIDWRQDATRDIIIDRVINKLHNSAIILMHPTQETVRALPELIEYLFAENYKITTVGNLME
ncbi:MAG: polysaccharide deacetylase family protein [Tissierellia bacterium]|nr:polysaccharide deacetylase family protein [Tissierellia bacterium]